MANKARQLINDEIERLKAVKFTVQAQVDTTRDLLTTQKATLDGINSDIEELKNSFRQLGNPDSLK
jgi:hypothetical protein